VVIFYHVSNEGEVKLCDNPAPHSRGTKAERVKKIRHEDLTELPKLSAVYDYAFIGNKVKPWFPSLSKYILNFPLNYNTLHPPAPKQASYGVIQDKHKTPPPPSTDL